MLLGGFDLSTGGVADKRIDNIIGDIVGLRMLG